MKHHSTIPVLCISPWPHRLAWALALTIFPLIWMGGTVTTYEAGMAVPDWPTTYSYWFYPVQLWLAFWDIFLEHGHRLLAQLAGILAILLAVALWWLDDRKWMRWIGLALVAGVIAQGVLGGLRVWADDRVLARIHGCTAPLYFGLCAAVVAWTSRAWQQRAQSPLSLWEPTQSPLSRREPTQSPLSLWERVRVRAAGAETPPPSLPAPLPKGEGSNRLPRLAWLVTIAIYLEIVIGALLRRPSASGGFGGAKLWAWLQALTAGQVTTWFELSVWLKLIVAGLIACGAAWLVIGVLRQAKHERRLVRQARWLALVLLLQLALAAATWVTNYGWPAWFIRWVWPLQSAVVAQGRLLVVVTTAHVAVGSLALAASLSLALWLHRLLRGGRL